MAISQHFAALTRENEDDIARTLALQILRLKEAGEPNLDMLALPHDESIG